MSTVGFRGGSTHLYCQTCGAEHLERLFDLGHQPLCNEFWPPQDADQPQTFYPLCLYHCSNCSLVQLGYTIPTGQTFGEQYTYLTGTSQSLVDYYSKLASRLKERFELGPGDALVDIGSNDGTFLKAFQSLGLSVVGVEGAKQAVSAALDNGIPTVNRFFGKGVNSAIKENLPPNSKIRIITAMNVLAHTDNINELLHEVTDLMDENTIFVSQSHWLAALVKQYEFDTIYHEHLRYYTLGSLTNLFQSHGLKLFDAESVDFYGGSLLSYAAKRDAGRLQGLEEVAREEESIDVIAGLRSMKSVLLKNKAKLINLLTDIKLSGKRVVGVGAPMKASTLLNFYGITEDLVEYIGEVNPLKIGTVVPGVRIPVVAEELIFKDPPDYALLLSWNMADNIIPKYRSKGFAGKFILPVPEVKVIDE